jgi:hypothetical protein
MLSAGNSLSIMRADNTMYAWAGLSMGWTFPGFIPGGPASTFAGHFDAPSAPSPTPEYGDHLVGVNGTGPFGITFGQGVSAVGFSLSTRLQVDFMASLAAYSEDGSLLSTLSVDARGLGGFCAGLDNTSGPVPCNDAPFLALRASDRRIASVVLNTNDPAGVFINTLYLDTSGSMPVPEPGSVILMGGGLLCLGLAARRRRAPVPRSFLK